MRIKKYIVNSIPDALQMIRKDLGNDAIILNTKKIKTGGFLGLFTKQQIEVIAAIDQEKKSQNNVKASPITVKQEIPPVTEVADPIMNEQWEERQGIEPSLSPVQPKKIPSHSAVQSDEILDEIKNMKKVMQQMLGENRNALPEPIQYLDQILMDQQVSNHIRSEIITRLMLKINQSQVDHKQIIQMAKEELQIYLNGIQPETDEKFAKIVCFIGPTGVGKTTTIAKLAADLLIKHKKKVGFITTDTYRIAAVEQLKTYANILNMPIEVVFSPEELEGAVENLAECDMILMDTAGRNYLQLMYVEELEQMLPKNEEIQINLVLSLTSKTEDMDQIVKNFDILPIDRLILTKLDETSSYGMILNLIEKHSFPLTYITNGQNVPDDILVASPHLITDLILGEDNHERPS
ncbi:flagellar biosynthesis protein FlhF [Caldalkalibacillus mannanilyticus]|uniref:flagellar biosynthesis protein FlhF n=1 Tax=Caldalkalibacillus mannanilyticus TaxID=1418 RepID=UPI00046A49CB|nr:flagellar biosynthesis protein FlhF [Caldalkalibacillus mannanilyticus]